MKYLCTIIIIIFRGVDSGTIVVINRIASEFHTGSKFGVEGFSYVRLYISECY